MGIAAYNRGTALVSRMILEDRPDSDAVLLGELSEISRHRGTTTLFQETVIRFEPSTSKWWVMDRPEEGWSSYGIPYQNLREIAAIYRFHFVGFGRDSHSLCVVATPLPRIEK